jgi:hypothetical protein
MSSPGCWKACRPKTADRETCVHGAEVKRKFQILEITSNSSTFYSLCILCITICRKENCSFGDRKYWFQFSKLMLIIVTITKLFVPNNYFSNIYDKMTANSKIFFLQSILNIFPFICQYHQPNNTVLRKILVLNSNLWYIPFSILTQFYL